jgi:hypothetical protein
MVECEMREVKTKGEEEQRRLKSDELLRMNGVVGFDERRLIFET